MNAEAPSRRPRLDAHGKRRTGLGTLEGQHRGDVTRLATYPPNNNNPKGAAGSIIRARLTGTSSWAGPALPPPIPGWHRRN